MYQQQQQHWQYPTTRSSTIDQENLHRCQDEDPHDWECADLQVLRCGSRCGTKGKRLSEGSIENIGQRPVPEPASEQRNWRKDPWSDDRYTSRSFLFQWSGISKLSWSGVKVWVLIVVHREDLGMGCGLGPWDVVQLLVPLHLLSSYRAVLLLRHLRKTGNVSFVVCGWKTYGSPRKRRSAADAATTALILTTRQAIDYDDPLRCRQESAQGERKEKGFSLDQAAWLLLWRQVLTCVSMQTQSVLRAGVTCLDGHGHCIKRCRRSSPLWRSPNKLLTCLQVWTSLLQKKIHEQVDFRSDVSSQWQPESVKAQTTTTFVLVLLLLLLWKVLTRGDAIDLPGWAQICGQSPKTLHEQTVWSDPLPENWL